jgi:hypothetical protein
MQRGTLATGVQMSNSALHAQTFYREVAQHRKIWTIRDGKGFPAPMTSAGHRAQPFWSSVTRAERIISDVPSYSGFKIVEISWEDFIQKWVPGLSKDKVLIGLNWSGRNATGYDIEPEKVKEYVESLRVPLEKPLKSDRH